MPNFETQADFQNEIFKRLGESSSGALGVLVQKKLQEKQRKQQLQDAVRKAIVSGVMSGKMKSKTPMDLNSILNNENIDLSQFEPVLRPTQKTSISISERPYSEIIKAREILGRKPTDYEKAGMATSEKSGGLFGNWGPGSKKTITLSPEAEAEQAEAKQILENPHRIAKRISGISEGQESDDLDEDILEFDDEAEAEAANLPKGTIVKINGHAAIIE